MAAGVDAPSSRSRGVVGTARLPRTVAGEQAAPPDELLIDSRTGEIIDVAVTIQLAAISAAPAARGRRSLM
jgi:hypothetical protein